MSPKLDLQRLLRRTLPILVIAILTIVPTLIHVQAASTIQGESKELKGIVEIRPDIGKLSGMWTINGVLLSVTDKTVFFGFGAEGPRVGACVEVAYNPSTTPPVATKITPDNDCVATGGPEIKELKGKIKTQTELGANGTWTIGDLPFEISDATFFDGFGGTRPLANACVSVIYIVKDGKNIAQRIRPEDTCGGATSDRSFRGPVDARPVDKVGDWVIGGQTFAVTTTTAFDTSFTTLPVVGDCVGLTYSVTGTSNTRTVATIFPANCGQESRSGVFEAHGVVEKLPSSDKLAWTISGVDYGVTAETRQSEDYGRIRVGTCVQVHYKKDVYYGTVRLLVSIESESNYRCKPSAEEHEFYGRITKLPGTPGELGSWTVGNLVLVVTANTKLVGAPFTTGQLVAGKFQRSVDGSLIATEIKVKRSSNEENDHRGIGKALGLIESLASSDAPGGWIISGTSYSITAKTRLEGFNKSTGPVVGNCVEVYFQADAAGARTAQKISREDTNTCTGNQKVYGSVTTMPVTTTTTITPTYQGNWTVGGVVYHTDLDTEFVEDHGPLSVGAFVVVVYDPSNRLIKKIRTVVPPGAGDSGHSGRLTMGGAAPKSLTAATSVSWTIGTIVYQVTADTLIDDTAATIQDGTTVNVNGYTDTAGNLIATQVTSAATVTANSVVYLPLVVR